jgi:hypothetical protein
MLNGLEEPKINKYVRCAYQKGYRVTEEGVLIGLSDNVLPIKLRSTNKYPFFTIRYEGRKVTITVHKFAAYCFYGEIVLSSGLDVRHLNSDVTDASKINIVTGTRSENMHDMPKEKRIALAVFRSKARAGKGIVGHNRKLSHDQARDIKQRLRDGETGASIARFYKVSDEVIYQIKRGDTYQYVD